MTGDEFQIQIHAVYDDGAAVLASGLGIVRPGDRVLLRKYGARRVGYTEYEDGWWRAVLYKI